jgi:hypothetical protein
MYELIAERSRFLQTQAEQVVQVCKPVDGPLPLLALNGRAELLLDLPFDRQDAKPTPTPYQCE